MINNKKSIEVGTLLHQSPLSKHELDTSLFGEVSAIDTLIWPLSVTVDVLWFTLGEQKAKKMSYEFTSDQWREGTTFIHRIAKH
jgi:hypothetical protein